MTKTGGNARKLERKGSKRRSIAELVGYSESGGEMVRKVKFKTVQGSVPTISVRWGDHGGWRRPWWTAAPGLDGRAAVADEGGGRRPQRVEAATADGGSRGGWRWTWRMGRLPRQMEATVAGRTRRIGRLPWWVKTVEGVVAVADDGSRSVMR